MSLVDAVSAVEDVTDVIGVSLNVLLIYLVIRHSSTSLGTYRYLTVIFGANNLIALAAHKLLQEKVFTESRIFAVVTMGPLGHLKYAALAYCAVFALNLSILNIHFLYRFIAVRFPFRIDIFQKLSLIALLISVVVLLVCIWCTLVVATFYPTEPGLTRVAESARAVYGISNEQFRRFSVIMADFNRGGSLNWTPIVGLLGYSFVILATFTFTAILGIMTIISAKTKRMHLNLLIVLTAQTVDPIVLYYTPSSIVLLGPLLGIEVPLMGICCSAFLALYSMTDALVVIFMMADYRNALFRGIKKLLIWLKIMNQHHPKAIASSAFTQSSILF